MNAFTKFMLDDKKMGAVGAVVMAGLFMAVVDSEASKVETAKVETAKVEMRLPTYSLPVDANHVISDNFRHDAGIVNEMIHVVTSYGYRCNSISAAQPALFGNSLLLTCNNWRYAYEIEDKGGFWRVKVD